MTLKLYDDSGRVLDATVTEKITKDGAEYTFESRGGGRGTAGERNTDYALAMDALLKQLQQNNMKIQDILIASARLKNAPLADRRVNIPNMSYPLNLDGIGDLTSLRKDITSTAARVGSQSKSGGGNPTRRLCILAVKSDG